MVFTFLGLIVAVPAVWHWFCFDRAEVSARSAILLGVGFAAFAWLRESWEIGILVFFLAALCEFAIAYVIGLIYSFFASAERTDYMDSRKAAGPSASRNVIGAVGAIAIPVAIFAAWVAHGLQTGSWQLPPTKALLGYCAFLLLGVVAVPHIVGHRRQKKEKRDAGN